MKTLQSIMQNQMQASRPLLLDGDFDDMLPEESLFYETPAEDWEWAA